MSLGPYISLALGMLIAAAGPASAFAAKGTEIVCINPMGSSYFPPSQIAAGADTGWQTDGITGGVVTITLSPDDDAVPFSITTTDATGRTFSVADEADLRASFVDAEAGIIRFDAAYSPGHTETYVVTGLANRDPLLMMTTVRADSILPVSKVFVAQCAAR